MAVGKKRGPKPKGGTGTPVFVRCDKALLSELDAFSQASGWSRARARALRYIARVWLKRWVKRNRHQRGEQ